MTVTHPMQRTFDELRRARAADPATSKAAARAARGLAGEHRAIILSTLRKLGEATSSEIAVTCGLSVVQVARRMAELRDDGQVFDTGRTRPTATGRESACWAVCP